MHLDPSTGKCKLNSQDITKAKYVAGMLGMISASEEDADVRNVSDRGRDAIIAILKRFGQLSAKEHKEPQKKSS